ncbi:helix-turn-helix domain-containing protein [Mycolicibacterium mengxianglii]|uniref:helix-turn-helix domain-containing protein n=1 Tax=Mycolicibacterium mengxianglii TaxID=2736649 RepID=UPI0018D1AFCA|nr:helix-turn-helix domain-containing protein [Mycolicibacterium mengxianglii]
MPSIHEFAPQVLERLPSPVWVVQGDGEIAFANTAAAVEVGWSDPRQLLGMPSHETVHHRYVDGSDYPRDACLVLRNGTPMPFHSDSDEWFIRRDGSMFPIAWSCAPIEMPSGSGIVVAFRDVSADRQRNLLRHTGQWEAVLDAAPSVKVVPANRELLMNRIRSFIVDNALDAALDPTVVAKEHHISLRLLQGLFAEAGSSPARFIRDRRLMHARKLLDDGESISRAAALSGFSDLGTFTRAFRRRFGCTPSSFLRGYHTLP